mmetsp:Transcript_41625/g.114779  ORF Transcript_41625/g.114779 Transcript_41625/m.114779 type:complete len:331 (+) Transcript_41625:624-1616(+)
MVSTADLVREHAPHGRVLQVLLLADRVGPVYVGERGDARRVRAEALGNAELHLPQREWAAHEDALQSRGLWRWRRRKPRHRRSSRCDFGRRCHCSGDAGRVCRRSHSRRWHGDVGRRASGRFTSAALRWGRPVGVMRRGRCRTCGRVHVFIRRKRSAARKLLPQLAVLAEVQRCLPLGGLHLKARALCRQELGALRAVLQDGQVKRRLFPFVDDAVHMPLHCSVVTLGTKRPHDSAQYVKMPLLGGEVQRKESVHRLPASVGPSLYQPLDGTLVAEERGQVQWRPLVVVHGVDPLGLLRIPKQRAEARDVATPRSRVELRRRRRHGRGAL